MKLLLLAGNSKSNKEWIEEVHTNLQNLFDESEILYYSHWVSEEPKDIDLDLEIEKLSKLTEDKEDYMIFAKSAGSLLLLKAIHQNRINPNKVFIVGLPANWGKEKGYEFEKWLESLNHTPTFIQKTYDPQMSYEDISNFLQSYENLNHELVEIEGDTHHY
jgi:hypothetical protein